MKRLLINSIFLSSVIFNAYGQDEESSTPLEISGSIDTYYKYDFSGHPNIGTSFANDHNSFSIGMLNVIATKKVGKASFVADVALGPRNARSVGPSAEELQPGIQNMYVSIDVTEKFTVAAGYMATYVGYELISPTGNFNYSTSYLFTNGPFQNAGVRLTYAFSDKVSVMAGVFNDWNVYSQTDEVGVNTVGGQIALTPVEDWNVYINVINGTSNGSEFDITTGYQLSEKLYAGLNAAYWSYNIPESTDISSFMGVAGYLQYSLTDAFSLGTRVESFSTENSGYIGYDANTLAEASNVKAFTLSGNIKTGNLTFIPELRLDMATEDVFIDSSSKPTSKAAQALVAAVFTF